MRVNSFYGILVVSFAILFAAQAHAKDNVILRFNVTDGANPSSALVSDGQGNLYGIAQGGNTSCYGGCGVVFQLSPLGNGKWREVVIYKFDELFIGPGALIFGKDGNLYGTMSYDSIFRLSYSGGEWKRSIIYTFDPSQGQFFGSQLAMDDQGNLYGTLVYSQYTRGGLVFELNLTKAVIIPKILHGFGSATSADGKYPYGGVVLDSKGNLYGTTTEGGLYGEGTVFELSPNANGAWSEKIIYNFNGPESQYPQTPMTIGPDGNLYGTAGQTVFQLTQSNDGWIERTIFTFGQALADGSEPSALTFDASGNAYGTTVYGGGQCNTPGCGIVFELTPNGEGRWGEKVLHRFESAGDGSEANFSWPSPQPYIDNSTGLIYGVTTHGGDMNGDGTIYSVESRPEPARPNR